MTHDVEAAEHVKPPGVEIAVNETIGSPLEAPAFQLTITSRSPRTAVTLAGDEGTPAGFMEALSGDGNESPTAFVATTVIMYVTPFVRPEIVQLVLTAVQSLPPGVAVARYPVIAEPPSDVGAFHEIKASPSPRIAVTPVGGIDSAAGVTALDADEKTEAPTALKALTVNVYCTPFVSPVTVQDKPEVVQVIESGVDVTMYDVTEAPLLDVGADQETLTSWLPRWPTTLRGAVGTPAGVTDKDGLDAAESPTPLVATTLNV